VIVYIFVENWLDKWAQMLDIWAFLRVAKCHFADNLGGKCVEFGKKMEKMEKI